MMSEDFRHTVTTYISILDIRDKMLVSYRDALMNFEEGQKALENNNPSITQEGLDNMRSGIMMYEQDLNIISAMHAVAKADMLTRLNELAGQEEDEDVEDSDEKTLVILPEE